MIAIRPTFILALCAGAAFSPPALSPRAESSRSIWITRWDYQTAEDVERLVEVCADAGFDELLFQVRGNASTFYPSKLEPWAAELGGADPGFDPLALALKHAHQRGLRLQAWVNVVPAWWGKGPPADAKHVVNVHPEWLWYDAKGTRQPYSERFYISLNPCLPEVRGYLVAVLEELLENYEVDGLHLDYIRFPNEPPATPKGLDYPRDPRTLELFRAARGANPDESPKAWDEWRSEQITILVREIRAMQKKVRPAAKLTAAVGCEPESAAAHFQDWPGWVDESQVDVLYPMNYTGDEQRFARRVASWKKRNDSVQVVMGLHATNSEPETLRARMRTSAEQFDGFALFGYLYLWDSRNKVIDTQSEKRSAERSALRKALLPLEAR
jgi:uncharacterized lipoprotein YddW (UPF0748 family)